MDASSQLDVATRLWAPAMLNLGLQFPACRDFRAAGRLL